VAPYQHQTKLVAKVDTFLSVQKIISNL